jgi:hypothetical protein
MKKPDGVTPPENRLARAISKKCAEPLSPQKQHTEQ